MVIIQGEVSLEMKGNLHVVNDHIISVMNDGHYVT